MKTREMIRRSCYVTAVTLLCFGPGAFAQSSRSSLSAASVTRSAGVLVLGPFADDFKRDKKKKKRVAADEGGSPALYLLLAGLVCCGAMVVRSRQALTQESL
jgi:hypothetical protein